MWPKRKRKNRRFERAHILDVKLRSTQRRAVRVRNVSLALGAAMTVLFGLFAIWRGGEWALRALLYENASFAIRQLDAQTDGVIAPEQVRRWAGVKSGENLLALDLARVKRDLELIPNIQSVAVERILPHTLKIRVSEREPMAQFVFPQAKPGGTYERGVYLIDAEGYVMLPLETQQRTTPAPTNDRLPTLIGVQAGDMRPGRQVESPQVHAALRLIEAFERSPMASLVDFKQIDVTSVNTLQVNTGQSSEITFGLNDFDGQLRRWRTVYDHGQKFGKQVAWIDLSVANNVPARWLEASLVPPPSPKNLKPSRNRKKNV